MYISDIDGTSKRAAKTALIYLLVSVLCGIFGAVYEIFSHEVYSFYMIYAFAFPLVGGTLPFLLMALFSVQKYPNAVVRNLYHSAIATLTVGSVIRGILDIYGTTNHLSEYYWLAGISLYVLGVATYCVQCLQQRS